MLSKIHECNKIKNFFVAIESQTQIPSFVDLSPSQRPIPSGFDSTALTLSAQAMIRVSPYPQWAPFSFPIGL